MTDSRVPVVAPYEERSPFSPAGNAPRLERAIPVAGELPGYRPGTARSDLIAGVTVSALAYVKARVREAVRGAPQRVHWLVFDAEAMARVDATGLEALQDIERALAHDGVTLLLARMKGALEARLTGTGLGASIGQDRRFPTVRAAVEYCIAHDLVT